MVIKKFNQSESAKNFLQVGIDVTCMHTIFGGRGFHSFGVMTFSCLPSQTAKIFLQTMGYSPWGSKTRIGSKNSCK